MLTLVICVLVCVLQGEIGVVVLLDNHNKGCHCKKKTGCRKKYYESVQANIILSENCEFLDCKRILTEVGRDMLCFTVKLPVTWQLLVPLPLLRFWGSTLQTFHSVWLCIYHPLNYRYVFIFYVYVSIIICIYVIL